MSQPERPVEPSGRANASPDPEGAVPNIPRQAAAPVDGPAKGESDVTASTCDATDSAATRDATDSAATGHASGNRADRPTGGTAIAEPASSGDEPTRPSPAQALPVGAASAQGLPVGAAPPQAVPAGAALAETAPPSLPALMEMASQPKRRTALLVTMTTLAAVLLVAAGVMTYAFISRNNAYQKQTGVVAQRDSTVRSDADQIRTLKSQLAAARAQNDQLQRQIAGSSGQVAELTTEKAALSKCINSVTAYFNAAGDNVSDTALKNAASTMEADCAIAHKYLK